MYIEISKNYYCQKRMGTNGREEGKQKWRSFIKLIEMNIKKPATVSNEGKCKIL